VLPWSGWPLHDCHFSANAVKTPSGKDAWVSQTQLDHLTDHNALLQLICHYCWLWAPWVLLQVVTCMLCLFSCCCGTFCMPKGHRSVQKCLSIRPLHNLTQVQYMALLALWPLYWCAQHNLLMCRTGWVVCVQGGSPTCSSEGLQADPARTP